MKCMGWNRLLLAATITVAVGCAGPAPSVPPASATGSVGRSPSASRPAPDTTPRGASPSTAASLPTPTAAQPSPLEDEVFQAMVEVIAHHRPAFGFRFQPDRVEGDWRLDGDVDDGMGPGRLFIDVTDEPGALTLDPCADRDFTQGGECTERVLSGGDRLVSRGLVEWDGIRTVMVTLIHPDRSGLTAEAANVSILGETGPRLGGSLGPSRELPLYSVTELAELVFAIDQHLREVRAGD